MQVRLLAAALLFILPACMAPQPTPTLDLRYAPNFSALAKNSLTVVVLKPVYRETPQLKGGAGDTETEIGPADTIPQKYKADYVPRLQASIQTDLEKLFVAKGFVVSKPSGSFVDKSGMDERNADVVITASFDLAPQVTNHQAIQRYPAGIMRIVNEGMVKLTGSLVVEMTEPVSQQRIMTQKIEVVSLNANESKEYEDPQDADSKFLELLNTVYPRLMEKLASNITAGNLEAAINTIKRLKEKGRPAPADNKPL